jgi:hypothetical protein
MPDIRHRASIFALFQMDHCCQPAEMLKKTKSCGDDDWQALGFAYMLNGS